MTALPSPAIGRDSKEHCTQQSGCLSKIQVYTINVACCEDVLLTHSRLHYYNTHANMCTQILYITQINQNGNQPTNKSTNTNNPKHPDKYKPMNTGGSLSSIRE